MTNRTATLTRFDGEPLAVLDGVYAPQADTDLLRSALEAEADRLPGSTLLELCCGSGALSVAAARRGATVEAVDHSSQAAHNATLNARLLGVALKAQVGDLFDPVGIRRFDTVIANPPYVPGPRSSIEESGAGSWYGGLDGRDLLDRICFQVDQHLNPGGVVLIVQSSLADPKRTMTMLDDYGIDAGVVEKTCIPLGPVSRGRLGYLIDGGYSSSDRFEDIVVIRGQSTVPASQQLRQLPQTPRDRAIAISSADVARR